MSGAAEILLRWDARSRVLSVDGIRAWSIRWGWVGECTNHVLGFQVKVRRGLHVGSLTGSHLQCGFQLKALWSPLWAHMYMSASSRAVYWAVHEAVYGCAGVLHEIMTRGALGVEMMKCSLWWPVSAPSPHGVLEVESMGAAVGADG